MRVWRPLGVGSLIGLCLAAPGAAQMPPSRVVFAEAREHSVRRTVELPGTVEARTAALVASEVDGLVEILRVREGRTVRKGQALVQLRTRDLELRLEAAEAGLREAEARLRQAEGDLERNQNLADEGILSASQFDESRFERDAWRGRADQLSAEISRIRLDIERSSVKAPFSGVVVAERCEVGEWVGRGDPVAEMASLHDLEVRVDVPERYFSEPASGARRREVRFEALAGLRSRDRQRSSAIVPARPTPSPAPFPLKVRIANPDGTDRGRACSPASPCPRVTPTGRLVVPKDADHHPRRGDRHGLPDQRTTTRWRSVPVDTGAGVGSWVEIRKRPRRPGPGS